MHSLRTWRRRSRLIRERTRQLRALHQRASRHAKPNARLTITSTSASRLFLKPSRSVRTSRPSTSAGQSPCCRGMGSSPATAATESGRDSTGLECMRRLIQGGRVSSSRPHSPFEGPVAKGTDAARTPPTDRGPAGAHVSVGRGVVGWFHDAGSSRSGASLARSLLGYLVKGALPPIWRAGAAGGSTGAAMGYTGRRADPLDPGLAWI